MSFSVYQLLVAYGVGCTGNSNTPCRVIETIAVANGEVLQGDIAALQVQSSHTPVVLVLATPGVAGQGEGQDGLIFIFSFQDDVVLFKEDFLVVDAGANEDMPWCGRIGGQAVESFLDGSEVAVAGGVHDEALGETRITGQQDQY